MIKINNMLLNQRNGFIDPEKLKTKMSLPYKFGENKIEMCQQGNFIKRRNMS